MASPRLEAARHHEKKITCTISHIDTMTKQLLFTAISLLTCIAAHPADYLISPSWQSGDTKTIHGVTFTRGADNVFTSYAALIASGIADGSTIHFDAGTYADAFTVAADNVTLLGYNAFRTTASGTRLSDESAITATVTVTADGVTINGFRLTANGKVNVTAGTYAAPQRDFTFIYNDVTASTLKRDTSDGIVRVGTYHKGSEAAVAANTRHHENVTISHNSFTGSSANLAGFVLVAGSFGNTTVTDNTFNDGGTSVSLMNTQGYVAVKNNNFKDVGKPLRDTNGEFCLRLYYIAQAGSTTVDVMNNVFDGCDGQKSVYPCIRFYNGDGSSSAPTLTTSDCLININYNTFLNKTKVLADSPKYNYVFYNRYNPEAKVNFRFNRYDCSEYAMGQSTQPWETSTSTYFASATGLFDHAASKGTTLSYYKDPAGNDVSAVKLKSTRVAQSFDIDDVTGDIYFIQICPNSESGLSLSAEEPLCVTRYYKNSSGTMSQQYMYLDNAGHGSNMAVCNIGGTCYIFTGGNSDYTTKVRSRACAIFPFVSKATADLSKSSFTYGGKTYDIKLFRNQWGRNWQYPTVDRDNNLYVERETLNGVVYVAFYNLDDVFNNVNDATPIKVIEIPYDSNPYSSSDSSLQGFVSKDTGFQTWPAQGFGVSGDYVYFLEGVGEEDSDAVTYSSAKIPTVMFHVINWRDDKFAYRKPTVRKAIIGLTHGEPEGVKFHRDSNGRTHMLVGIASGASGARRANIFDFSPAQQSDPTVATVDKSTCLHYSLTSTSISSTVSSLSFSSEDGSSESRDLTVGYTYPSGEATYHIAGPDAQCFSVSGTPSAFATSETLTVTYRPTDQRDSHQARLIVSSPTATSLKVDLDGSQSITSSVNAIGDDRGDGGLKVTDGTVRFPDGATAACLYNLQGQPMATTAPGPGLYVARYSLGGVNHAVKINLRR